MDDRGDLPEEVVAAFAGVPVPDPMPAPALGTGARAELAQFVALRAAACVGADYSNLALGHPDDSKMLRLFHGAFLDPEVQLRYVDIAREAAYPIAVSVREDRAVVLRGKDDYLAEFPDIWEDTYAAGVEASVCLPLTRSNGSTIGAIGFAWSTAPSFGVKLDNALQAVAHLVTEIVERAEVYEAEHRLIAALHERLLSALPRHDRLATAARYLPAGTSAAVGGDWYEGITLDDGSLTVVVGDVTGHGLAAAADMALIRGLITALLHDGVPVAEVFGRVSRVLARRPDKLLATAALAVVDPGAATLTYATAGHPPPLLLLPDGSVQLLDAANAPILGIATSRQVAQTLAFPPGATLVMYTDGLVEARDRPFTEGVEQAAALLSAQPARLDPERYVDLLLDALVGEHRDHDDIAVVVVQHLR